MGDYSAYREIELGDKTLSARVNSALEQLASDPAASISAACKNPHQAKGVYRLLSNKKFTAHSVLDMSQSETISKIRESGAKVVLIPQDTTVLNYSGLKNTAGLGTIDSSGKAKGLLAHSAIAVGEDGRIFGLLAQKVWDRPKEEIGKKALRKKLPIEEKESYKWLETMRAAKLSDRLEHVKSIHLCDREGDIYELFANAFLNGETYICRRAQERIVADSEQRLLNKFIDKLPPAGELEVAVPRDSHTQREARTAKLAVKFGRTRIQKPTGLQATAPIPEFVDVCVISAVEVNPPKDAKDLISWQLITNDSVEDFESAINCISRYTQRWKIEIFHRTLKDGCKIEKLQASSAEKIVKLIAMYSIIALRIMIMTYLARVNPDASCEEEFETEEWQILYKIVYKTKTLPEKPPSIAEAVVMLAKLGGFLARKSDGFPGVTVIWRGLAKLDTALETARYLS